MKTSLASGLFVVITVVARRRFIIVITASATPYGNEPGLRRILN